MLIRKLLLAASFLCLTASSFAQKYKINWGDELKMKKGTLDLDIIGADNSGYYFLETKAAARGISFGFSSPYYNTYKLLKFSNDFEQEYDESYKSELKGLDFLSIQPLNNDLYIFATDFIKKEKMYKVFGTKIDKSSGKLASEFTELGSYERESKKDDFEAKLTKINKGKNFLLVSDLTGKENTRLAVSVLDGQLKHKSTTNINLNFLPGFFTLQDVKMVNDRIVILGKSFEEEETKKRKKKKIFKSFVLTIYDLKGKKINDIPLDLADKFTLEGTLLELDNNEVALAGFFSKDGKKKNLNGFFINKIDVNTGALTVSSTKEITSGMLGQNYADDADDDDKEEEKKSSKKKSDDDEDEEFPNEFSIKSVEVNPADGSFMIAAEISQLTVTSYQTYQPSGGGMAGGSWRTTYVYRFTNKDILLISADKNGSIKWLNAIPKKQLESISSSTSGGYGFFSYTDRAAFFAKAGGMPYHSSFKSTFVKDKYVIIYNDNKSNDEVSAYGDKIKSISNFKKRGEMFGLSFDLATGKATKTPISACSDDDVITMPRHSYVVGNNIIVPAWRQRALGKTIFKIAKVTLQ